MTTATKALPKLEIVEKRLDQLRLNKHNPRKIQDSDPHIRGLADSIDASGLFSPITIRKLKKPAGKITHELVFGECRYRAHRVLKRKTIPSIIRTMTDEEAAVALATENLQRQDLKPLEESDSIALLQAQGWTHEQVAKELGKSPSWVAGRVALQSLAKVWTEVIQYPQGAGRNGRENHEAYRVHLWPAATLVVIARYSEEIQERLYKDLSYRLWGYLDADDVRNAALDYHRDLSKAPWDVEDMDLPGGACTKCPKRSSCKGLLFDFEEDELTKGDTCLDKACFAKKHKAYHKRALTDAKAKHGDELVIVAEHDYDVKTGQISPKKATKCKKSARGARPAFYPKTGKVSYVTVPKGVTPAKKRTQGGDRDWKHENAKRDAEWARNAIIEKEVHTLMEPKLKRRGLGQLAALAVIPPHNTNFGKSANKFVDAKGVPREAAVIAELTADIFRSAQTWGKAVDWFANHFGIDFKAIQKRALEKHPVPKKAKPKAEKKAKPKKKPNAAK